MASESPGAHNEDARIEMERKDKCSVVRPRARSDVYRPLNQGAVLIWKLYRGRDVEPV
jgi:hypothetical protein